MTLHAKTFAARQRDAERQQSDERLKAMNARADMSEKAIEAGLEVAQRRGLGARPDDIAKILAAALPHLRAERDEIARAIASTRGNGPWKTWLPAADAILSLPAMQERRVPADGWTFDEVLKGLNDAAAFCDCSNHPDASEWASACRIAWAELRAALSSPPAPAPVPTLTKQECERVEKSRDPDCLERRNREATKPKKPLVADKQTERG